AFSGYRAEIDLSVIRRPCYQNLLICEVMCNPLKSDANKEYIEIMNTGEDPIPLSVCSIVDGASSSSPYCFPADSVIPAYGRITVAQSADEFTTEYKTDPDYCGFSFALNNNDETVFLIKDGAEILDCVYIGMGSNEYPAPSEWGELLPAPAEGKSAHRIAEQKDSNTSADWKEGEPDPGK
ncbi:MAG: lamin tail domain-containing protein, partial [Spirochaetota bacterium]